VTSPSVHVTVPYFGLDQYLPIIKKESLNLEIYFSSGRFDEIQKSDIIELRDVLDYNPKLTIHSPFMDLSPAAVDPIIREATFKRYSSILDFASVLEPRVVVFHSGYYRWNYENKVDKWLKGSLKTWRLLNKRAEDLGVKIAIENIFEDEPGNLRMLAEEMGSENFGLCVDVGHINLFSRIPLQEWLQIVRPFIKEMHIHDNDGSGDDHLPIGDGNLDFDTVFKMSEGLDCVYTIEAHTVENARKSLERIGKYLV